MSESAIILDVKSSTSAISLVMVAKNVGDAETFVSCLERAGGVSAPDNPSTSSKEESFPLSDLSASEISTCRSFR